MAFFDFLGRSNKQPSIPLPPPNEEEDAFPLPSDEVKEAVEVSESEEGSLPQESGTPLFVDMRNYDQALSDLKTIGQSVQALDERFGRLHDLHTQKDKAYDKWMGLVRELQEKLLYVDGELFGKG